VRNRLHKCVKPHKCVTTCNAECGAKQVARGHTGPIRLKHLLPLEAVDGQQHRAAVQELHQPCSTKRAALAQGLGEATETRGCPSTTTAMRILCVAAKRGRNVPFLRASQDQACILSMPVILRPAGPQQTNRVSAAPPGTQRSRQTDRFLKPVCAGKGDEWGGGGRNSADAERIPRGGGRHHLRPAAPASPQRPPAAWRRSARSPPGTGRSAPRRAPPAA
jgi:hypothetical protein